MKTGELKDDFDETVDMIQSDHLTGFRPLQNYESDGEEPLLKRANKERNFDKTSRRSELIIQPGI